MPHKLNDDLREFLADVEFMVREEVNYCRTGRHNGVPMRDCLGQWASLAAKAKELFNQI